MSHTIAATSLKQELYAAHALVMQCGERASCFLDRARAAGPGRSDLRADLEGLRMGVLASRLMETVCRGITLAQSGRNPADVGALVGADLRLVLGPASGRTRGSARAELGSAPATPAPKLHAAPDAPRGRLKNGNPSGDYLRAPRCGARTRAGCPCRQPAMKNGRCRLHGGLSTGPRTQEGRRRARTARLVHGYRSAALIGLRSRAVHAARRLRALTAAARPAGHGVHRPDSISRVGATGRSPAYVPNGTAGDLPVAPTSTGISAGHGVDRPDASSVGANGARPLSSSLIESEVSHPRACAVRPYIRPLFAGHGVDRSFRDRLRCSAAAVA